MRRRVHTPEDGESLACGCVEVVVVWDGGHAEAGVVLRGGVCAIAVPGALGQAAVPLLRQFCCFFILTLHTAHYLNSCRKQKEPRELGCSVAAELLDERGIIYKARRWLFQA